MNESSPICGLVLNYRDAARTSACIQSLVEAGIMKVLVFDNSGPAPGIMDGDPQGFGEAEIAVVLSDRNLGFSAGVNRGLEGCALRWPGHWVLLVNNDAIVPPVVPGRLAEALVGDTSAAVAFPRMRQGVERIGWAWYHPWLALITLVPLPGSFRYASGCCQLIAPERTGLQPFDEHFFMYGEDIEFAWRLGREGFHQHLDDGSEIIHEGSASSRRGSLFYETLLVESHLRLASKLSGGRAGRYAILLLIRMAVLPLRASVRAIRLRTSAPLLGLVHGARRAMKPPAPYP